MNPPNWTTRGENDNIQSGNVTCYDTSRLDKKD